MPNHLRPVSLLLLALSLAVPACGGSSTGGEPSGEAPSAIPHKVRTIKVEQLRQDLDAKKVPMLVDVRTAEEYAGGHVPGAVNIPLDTLEARRPELDVHKSDEIYLICESGRRSFSASQQLARYGYRPVNVDGGTAAWKNAGFPTE